MAKAIEIDDALLPLWGGVDADDLETHRHDSMGSDDVPHGSLTTRNTPRVRFIFGDCSAEQLAALK